MAQSVNTFLPSQACSIWNADFVRPWFSTGLVQPSTLRVPVLDYHVAGNRFKKEIIEIIAEAGIDIKDIDAFVLSH